MQRKQPTSDPDSYSNASRTGGFRPSPAALAASLFVEEWVRQDGRRADAMALSVLGRAGSARCAVALDVGKPAWRTRTFRARSKFVELRERLAAEFGVSPEVTERHLLAELTRHLRARLADREIGAALRAVLDEALCLLAHDDESN